MRISEMSSSYAFRLKHPVILSVFDISKIEESITDCIHRFSELIWKKTVIRF